MPSTLRDAWADLVLGATCVGCARPGRLLCTPCESALPTRAAPAWPSPTPAGLATPYAAGPYDGCLRALVLGLKEHRLLGLRRPLGRLLAASTAAALAGVAGPVALVPVPSRPRSVRQRGLDSTYDVTVAAARRLRAAGTEVTAIRLLRTRPGLRDQAGLSASERVDNLAGSMTCPSSGLVRMARRLPSARVLVCDDVLTTGATAREAQRALESVGLEVLAVAAVAATRRRVEHHPDPLPVKPSPPALGPFGGGV